MKLLYAEDEIAMQEAVTDILTFHNFSVDAVDNGEDALAYAETEDYDGIILDIMMPKIDGLTVLKELRNKGCRTPILLLTAKSEVEDCIQGLDCGADDYLAKPFATGELVARTRAMLRRKENYTPSVLTMGNLSLNLRNYELRCGEKSFILTKLEFQLAELLLLNRGMFLSSEYILTKIWGYDTEAEIGVVWVYISYLRKKFTALECNVEIRARRNIGYTLELKK